MKVHRFFRDSVARLTLLLVACLTLVACFPKDEPLQCEPSNQTLAERQASPICEAGPSGRCFYLDPVHGDDANDGSLTSPWRSFRNIYSYESPASHPARWVRLEPGDYVYLFEGVYDDIIYDGPRTPNAAHIFHFRGNDPSSDQSITLKAYPGNHPILDPSGRSIGMYLLQVRNWIVQGVEIRNAYERGLAVRVAENVRLERLYIHDTIGVDNHNLSGIEFLDVQNAELTGSLLHDNYDRDNHDTGGWATSNSRNMVVFSSGDVRIHGNVFYQSPPLGGRLGGACLSYKHASPYPNSKYEVFNNLFENCHFEAFGSSTQNTHFHHNVVVGGAKAMRSAGLGGPVHQSNQVFEYNTVYLSQVPIEFNPDRTYQNANFPQLPQRIVFRKNIAVGGEAPDTIDRNLVNIGLYMSDSLFTHTRPALSFEDNCYANEAGAVRFAIGAANGGAFGRLGSMGDLTHWSSTYGWDTQSLVNLPRFVNAQARDFALVENEPCSGKGAFATGTLAPKTLSPPRYGCSAGRH